MRTIALQFLNTETIYVGINNQGCDNCCMWKRINLEWESLFAAAYSPKLGQIFSHVPQLVVADANSAKASLYKGESSNVALPHKKHSP